MCSKAKEEYLGIKEDLKRIWPKLVTDICTSPQFENMPDANLWLETVMEKNVPHGKQARALLTVTFYNQLVSKDKQTEGEKKRCLIAGWCNEIMQAAALIADDIMDESETRRGQLCWHRHPEVGLSAVNDCLMLENISYFISYKYFEECDYFPRLLKHCHEISMITIMGQCMDTRTSLHLDLKACTWDTYKEIVKHKTSYYTFFHPIAAAMIMARIKDPKLLARVKEVALEIGYLFQAQDDLLDCFGDPEITGKVGTDIQDGKCTWLLLKALELASDSQRKSIENCYGQRGTNDENIIKEIYIALDIEEEFYTFETHSYRQISQSIEGLPNEIPKEPLSNILQLIYRREN